MPAHLYHVLGRYRDSINANLAAAKADEAWLSQSNEAGIYRYGYYPHNVHFVVSAAQLGGDKATALDQAARLRRILGVDVATVLPWVQVILCGTLFCACPVQFASGDFGATRTRPKIALCDSHVALFTRRCSSVEKRCGRKRAGN